jgi:hypothetical protein
VTDWVSISSMATAGATLVLAGATFSAVRSSNRSARIAEQALLAGQRPLLMPSRLDDPPVKFAWVDGHDVKLRGGEAHASVDDGIVFLALSIRNSGTGVAVIQGWFPHTDLDTTNPSFPDAEQFRRQSRDLYVGAGDIGFWQGALRDTDETQRVMGAYVNERERFSVDLLYSDVEGGQRTMTRFRFMPGDQVAWLGSVTRHTNVDRDDPR